jgi:hypothetical protein
MSLLLGRDPWGRRNVGRFRFGSGDFRSDPTTALDAGSSLGFTEATFGDPLRQRRELVQIPLPRDPRVERSMMGVDRRASRRHRSTTESPEVVRGPTPDLGVIRWGGGSVFPLGEEGKTP